MHVPSYTDLGTSKASKLTLLGYDLGGGVAVFSGNPRPAEHNVRLEYILQLIPKLDGLHRLFVP